MKALAKLFPALCVLLALTHLVRGGFHGVDRLGWPEALVLLLLLSGIGLNLARRIRRISSGTPRLSDDLVLGGGLVSAAYAVVEISGPQLFPILYLLMAFLIAFLQRTAALMLVGGAVVLEGLLSLDPPGSFLSRVIPRGIFLTLFAGLYHLVLTTRLAAAKRSEEEAVEKRIREVEERARAFRLISSGAEHNGAAEESQDSQHQWTLASVSEIEGTLGTALEVAEIALSSHTCAAFLLTPDDRFFKLYECRSASDHLQRDRFSAGEGILGSVLKRKLPVRIHSSRPLRGLTYYASEDEPIYSAVAVPILEGEGSLRGALLADRRQSEPFTERDEKLLIASATAVLRAIEAERVMGFIRRTRDEKVRFFRAIEELNRAQNPDQVSTAVIENLSQLLALDFCAITLVNEQDGARVHRIAKVSGVTDAGKALEGKTFADNHGLVSNVVRYGLSVLRIFPLTAGDRILGTLVAGSRTKGAFNADLLRMIEVMALQAAQALLRAQLFEQTERLAITDGLTGLLNHRAFQAKAEETLAQAKRYGRKCSIVLMDIDHFKKVNDTYGHPTGDLVLKGVARIIKDRARDTDIAARYGGEEFAIVMPETDAKGGRVIAERIREEVGRRVFPAEQAPVRVTLSLGIATFDDHAKNKQDLIRLADKCLYFAKQNGRNRCVSVDQIETPRPAARSPTSLLSY